MFGGGTDPGSFFNRNSDEFNFFEGTGQSNSFLGTGGFLTTTGERGGAPSPLPSTQQQQIGGNVRRRADLTSEFFNSHSGEYLLGSGLGAQQPASSTAANPNSGFRRSRSGRRRARRRVSGAPSSAAHPPSGAAQGSSMGHSPRFAQQHRGQASPGPFSSHQRQPRQLQPQQKQAQQQQHMQSLQPPQLAQNSAFFSSGHSHDMMFGSAPFASFAGPLTGEFDVPMASQDGAAAAAAVATGLPSLVAGSSSLSSLITDNNSTEMLLNSTSGWFAPAPPPAEPIRSFFGPSEPAGRSDTTVTGESGEQQGHQAPDDDERDDELDEDDEMGEGMKSNTSMLSGLLSSMDDIAPEDGHFFSRSFEAKTSNLAPKSPPESTPDDANVSSMHQNDDRQEQGAKKSSSDDSEREKRILAAKMALEKAQQVDSSKSNSTSATIQRRKPVARKKIVGDRSCAECNATQTIQWRRNVEGHILCNKCGLKALRRERNLKKKKEKEGKSKGKVKESEGKSKGKDNFFQQKTKSNFSSSASAQEKIRQRQKSQNMQRAATAAAQASVTSNSNATSSLTPSGLPSYAVSMTPGAMRFSTALMHLLNLEQINQNPLLVVALSRVGQLNLSSVFGDQIPPIGGPISFNLVLLSSPLLTILLSHGVTLDVNVNITDLVVNEKGQHVPRALPQVIGEICGHVSRRCPGCHADVVYSFVRLNKDVVWATCLGPCMHSWIHSVKDVQD